MRVRAIFLVLCMLIGVAFTSLVNANEIAVDGSTVDGLVERSSKPTADQVSENPSIVDPSASSSVSTATSSSTTSLLASLKDNQSTTRPNVSDGAVGKMFFGLMAILLLIFASSWMLKRLNINKFGMASSLSVNGVLPIGTKEKVVVVEIEGTRLVLGVTPTNISKLHVLEKEGTFPCQESAQEEGLETKSDFSEKMKKIMKEGLKSD